MKELFTEIVEEFKLYWKSYIFQSFLATLTTFLVLLALSVKHAVIVASIGSTAFIIFVTPEKKIARARNVIGGHLIGLITGSLCALIPHLLFLHSIIIYSLAVGFSILIMVITDTKHPPASGTALGVAISAFSLDVIITVIVSTIILSLVHYFLRPFLKDLR